MKPNTPFQRIPRDKLPENLVASWDRSNAMHGDTTFTEVMANAPAVYDWYSKDFYQKLFYSGRIDRAIIELVRFKLANVHGCASCNRGDRLASLEAGLSEAELDAIDDWENGPYTERQKVALAFAEVMVLTNPFGTVTPELYARAKTCFTDGELVELGVVMAVLAGMAKFIFAYDLLEKEDFCPFIPKIAAE